MRRKWIAVVGLWFVLASAMVIAETAKTNFTGTVTGTDDKIIENASVKLYMVTVNQTSMSYQVKLMAETQSDASGKFAFAEDIPAVNGYAMYCCLVEKEGLSCGWATATMEPAAVWTIKLTPPAKISGRILATDETPVANAEVRLAILAIPGSDQQFMIGIDPVEAFVTTTDKDGNFEFANLPADATAEFLVKCKGKGTTDTFDISTNPESGLTYKAGQSDITLTMADACKLIGSVVTQDNQKPVGGIDIIIRDNEIPVNLFRSPITSAEDGSFKIADLTPGEFIVQAVDDNWLAEPVTVSVVEGTDAEVKIELSKGGTLEVTAVEDKSKDPVAGVNISIRSDESQQYFHFTTDEKGLGSKQLAPGTYQLSAYRPGYSSVSDAGTVVVENGKIAKKTIELPEMPKLKALLTDTTGKPVEGASIRIYPGGGRRNESITSDAEGRLAVPWDPGQSSWHDGNFYLLAVHKEKNLAGVVSIDVGARETTVKLDNGVTVKGRVVNPDSEPIVGAKVRTWFDGDGFSSSMGQGVQTDASGEYTLTTLALTQKYSIRVSDAKGYGPGKKELEPGKEYERTLEDIILPIADQKVTGQVVDIDGKGLANVQLHTYGENQPDLNAKTDKDGKFVLENICVGEINISASYRSGNDYLSGHVRTEGGAEDVKIILSNQNVNSRFVPKKAVSLIGKQLPDLTACGVKIPADAGKVLVFAWDMNQRPSRHFIKQLTAKAGLLKEKSVTVLLLQTIPVEKEKLNDWFKDNNIAFPCGIITENPDEMKDNLGIQGLPWLILTDADHKVIAEGVSVGELEAKLN